MGGHARRPRRPGAAGLSRFDDRERVAEKDGPTRDLDHDAPGVDVASAAAVGQAAELRAAPAERTGVKATPVPAIPTPVQRQPAIEAPAPIVQLAPDGGGGGGTVRRSGGAPEIREAGPTAAVDAAMQLRNADAQRFDAILDEPVARTPVALRARKRDTPAPTRETEAKGEATNESV